MDIKPSKAETNRNVKAYAGVFFAGVVGRVGSWSRWGRTVGQSQALLFDVFDEVGKSFPAHFGNDRFFLATI